MQHRSTRIWIASKFVRNPKCKFWTANKVTAYYQGIIFDTTLGYPGEGKKCIKRSVSAKTKSLYDRRTNIQGSKEEYKKVQREIKASSLQDYKDWVAEWADFMQTANGRGDVKEIYTAVKALAERREKSPTNLTKNSQGKLLISSEEVAKVWEEFLAKKFAATTTEMHERPPMEKLPDTKHNGDTITKSKILNGLRKMPNGRACGPDNLPAELFKHSNLCREYLCEILQEIWDSEQVPVNFACANFTMIYKHKGSSNDPTRYRCIGPSRCRCVRQN